MFSADERDAVRDTIVALAQADPRIVAGAALGSLAVAGGDRWSDLDLSFAVADGTPTEDVLDTWTRELADTLGAVHLFDLRSGPIVYRVFLLPGCLQVDLSFSSAADFQARGPKFRLLFGTIDSVATAPWPSPPRAAHTLGLGVHHAIRARVSIERGRVWQAAHWINQAREIALALACQRRGLDPSHARSHDDLPTGVLDALRHTATPSMNRDQLLHALRAAVAGMLAEATEAPELAAQVSPALAALTADPD